MVNYEIRFKRSVSKDLRNLPNQDVQRILERIDGLRKNPRPKGVEKLSGQEKYRVRQGVYRIVYEIIDRELVVVIVTVGHRREIYRKR